MSNDKNKKPPEEAAANNLYANIMLNYFNAAPPMHMDGTPVEDCPWEKEVKKALDSANPIEAFERLTDEDEHIDIPEDATEWRALIDKISSNPIFKELPFVAQQELQEQAAESLEEAKDALQVLEEFGERDKADRADVERQMLKQARKVLIDNTRLTVSTSTETKDGDAFLYRNLQEDPSSVAVVEGMMKGLITRAARAAAIPLAGYVSMGGQLLPRFTDKDKRKKQAATLKDMTAAVDAETVAAMILEAIPQTFRYFKEHAPERAATLEEYARQEAKAAFASIIEYVEAVNAEPVEDEQAKRNQRQRDRRAAFEGLPVKRTKKTTTKVCAIDLASNNLLEDKFFNREYPADLELWTKKNGERVTARFNVIPDDTIADKLERLSSMDQVVLDSVNSIFKTDEKRNRIMTMQQVFEVMTGGEKRATKDRLKDIRERISRLTHTKIELHFPDEEAKKIGVRKDYTLEDNIIPGALITQNVNGEETTCLVLSRQMPLLWYAERKNQILRYDLGALDVGIADTTDNIILKNYLVSRVKSRMTPTIRYDTIYAKIGDMGKTPNSVRNKQRKIRDTAIKIMEQLVKQGEISAYKEIRNGRKIYSIEFKRAATKEA